MKKMMLFVALLTMSALGAVGQQAKGGAILIDLHATTKKMEAKKVPIKPATATNELFGKPVTYGGFLADLSKAEKKRAFFSLRTPVDPQKDLENIWFYPGTDKVQGLILFSIKF